MNCLERGKALRPEEGKPWTAYCSKECFEAAMKAVEK